MRRGLLLCSLAVLSLVAFRGWAEESDVSKLEAEGFEKLFDGKSLEGWTILENEKSFQVMPDGTLRVGGERSHAFSPKEYTDVVFRADVKTEPKANSGMYFRAEKMKGWPKGYESQVNNSHKDPKRTGSLYNFVNVTEQLVPDNEWYTEEITVKGNHIVIKINGKTVVDYVDEKNTHSKGYLALQAHDPGSVVYYKNIMAKDLSK